MAIATATASEAPPRGIRRFRRPRGILAHVILAAICIVVSIPFFWLVSTALKTTAEFYTPPRTFFPREPTLDNYAFALGKFPQLWHFFGNSVIVTIVTVALTVIISAMAGYAFAKLESRFGTVVFWAMVATLFMPIQLTSLIVLYEITTTLGLYDTLLGLILPYTSLQLPMYIFIMRTVFMGIPKELDDAARIDGASTWRVFVQIMVPLASPGLIVVAIITFTHIWGEYLWARTLASDSALTLGVGINVIQTNMGSTELPVMAAAYSVAILPPLLLFIFLQRWFLGGVTGGALKG
jgi:ABC-type glycerol-3-phosphate transport system permease component